jgi:outer membrane protein assembly factor BamB
MEERMRLLPGSRTWLAAGLLLTLCGLTGSGRAPAAKENGRDWPLFGGTIHRNLADTVQTGIPEEWSTKKGKLKNVKWVAALGTHAYGGPVVAGGRIFVGTNNDKPRDPKIKGDKGVVMCFRESDGKFLWQAVHEKLADENDAKDCGVASTPCVDGDRLYYVSNRCELVCADVAGDEATGQAKILWTLDMVKDLGVFPCWLANSSPLVVGDLVYAVTGNGVVPNSTKLPAPKAPSFVAVHKHTGKVAWTDNSPGDRIMDGQWTSPVAVEVDGVMQIIFPGGDGFLYAFEAKKGELIWKFDCNPKSAKPYKQGGQGERCFIVACPVIWENKLYVAVGQEPDDSNGVGHLWCIDVTKKPKNKDKDLSPVNDNFDPKAEVNKDSGLVWHFGGPILPKPDTGREYVFGRTLSTCAIHDGLVYAAELTGFLNCLNARTGEKYWEYDLKANTWSSPFYVDGKVYMGADDGTMYVFRHGKELKEPAKVEMDNALAVPPVAANGVLYVNNGASLYAIVSR